MATAGAAAAGNLVATYNFGTEGLEVYVPGSGILFDEGIVYNLTGAGGSVYNNYYRRIRFTHGDYYLYSYGCNWNEPI